MRSPDSVIKNVTLPSCNYMFQNFKYVKMLRLYQENQISVIYICLSLLKYPILISIKLRLVFVYKKETVIQVDFVVI